MKSKSKKLTPFERDTMTKGKARENRRKHRRRDNQSKCATIVDVQNYTSSRIARLTSRFVNFVQSQTLCGCLSSEKQEKSTKYIFIQTSPTNYRKNNGWFRNRTEWFRRLASGNRRDLHCQNTGKTADFQYCLLRSTREIFHWSWVPVLDTGASCTIQQPGTSPACSTTSKFAERSQKENSRARKERNNKSYRTNRMDQFDGCCSETWKDQNLLGLDPKILIKLSSGRSTRCQLGGNPP